MRFTSSESCMFSRDSDSGMSSLSTTPYTKRIQSGNRFLLCDSISTLREYSDTPGSMRPRPIFSVCMLPT